MNQKKDPNYAENEKIQKDIYSIAYVLDRSFSIFNFRPVHHENIFYILRNCIIMSQQFDISNILIQPIFEIIYITVMIIDVSIQICFCSSIFLSNLVLQRLIISNKIRLLKQYFYTYSPDAFELNKKDSYLVPTNKITCFGLRH